MKVALVTCYNQPDYIRAITLRQAASKLADIVVIKNEQKGLIRYLEVIYKLIKTRLKEHPDVYILTFRAYEIFPFARLITLGKPLVYDEFINPYEWLVLEHHKLKTGSLPAKIFLWTYSRLANTATLIMTDTKSHANFSAQLTGIRPEKFMPVIVGSDEVTFQPVKKLRSQSTKARLQVFYYGNMLPLHGLSTVLEAAVSIKDEPIDFTFVGGGEKAAGMCDQASYLGANVRHIAWIEYTNLPEAIAQADVCLAGPFGGTVQSRYVVTGKAYQFLSMSMPTIIGKNEESSIFTDKENALLVKQADVASLVEVLVWAENHRDKLAQIGKAGRKLFEKKLSHGVVENQLELILTRLNAKYR
mgnify:CR=1 FL=1